MKFLAFVVLPILLAQVPSCDQLPSGDLEYKDCEVADQREGYTCKAIYAGGKLLRKLYTEIKNPSPVPSVQPSNNPGPIPSTIPSASPIIPSPPIPSPINPPSPSSDFYCTLQPDGFYPTPPINECPACWRNDPNVIGYWGISLQSKRNCTGVNCGCGVVANVNLTPHSTDDKFLRHRYDFATKKFSGSETHKGCQPDEFSETIPPIWVYPPNDTPGLCDPFSGSRYWCHHKAKAGTCGATKFDVHIGEPPYKHSVIVQIP